MREMVPLAWMLQHLAGSSTQASQWLEIIGNRGVDALPSLGIRGDAAVVFTDRARADGLLAADNSVDRVRLAQLVLVLDIIAAVPAAQPRPGQDEPLVFTVPRAVERFLTPRQRLDLLVTDVIARAGTTLHIGGPFWNESGWETLRPVVLPALSQRRVAATFYLHPHESGHLTFIERMLSEAQSHGNVRALWWGGGAPSLMHAKFVVSDGIGGYFGSANLTSLGLGTHLEMGVGLTTTQAESLLELLHSLEAAGHFSPNIPVG